MKSIKTYCTIIFCLAVSMKAMSQDTTGVYFNPHLSYDLTLLPSYIEESGFEDPFEFNVTGYLSYGLEVGKFYPIGQLAVYFRYGKSILDDDHFEENGGLNGEVEFDSYWNLGISFQRRLWQNKERRKLKISLGYRGSATYHYFDGDRAFEDPNFNNDRIEKYTENIFGVESGLHFKFGSRKEGRENRVSFLWEPVYFRLQNKGFGFGVQRIGFEIKI